jgi:hypothetical protein
MAAAAASVAFVDTYRQTGSARAGVRAMGESFANSMSMGGYGMVQAISNDEAGHYLANYAANLATVGIYGTVRAFHDGQYGARIISVIQIAALAYGAYSAYQANSGTVSGETAGGSVPEDAAPKTEGGGTPTNVSESGPRQAVVRATINDMNVEVMKHERTYLVPDAVNDVNVQVIATEDGVTGNVTLYEPEGSRIITSRRSFHLNRGESFSRMYGNSAGGVRDLAIKVRVHGPQVVGVVFRGTRVIRQPAFPQGGPKGL